MTSKSGVSVERGRWSAKAKRDAVLRLLQGEDLDTLSRSLKVGAGKLSQWRETFLASGLVGFKQRGDDARDEEIGKLKTVLGEMTMRCELQRDAIRRLKEGVSSTPIRNGVDVALGENREGRPVA